MTKFVLRPAKVIADSAFRADLAKDSSEFGWQAFKGKFMPNGSSQAGLAKITALRPGCYIGLVKSRTTGGPVAFVLANVDRTGNLNSVLKSDPSFLARVIEVYKVEGVDWGAGSMDNNMLGVI